MRSLRADDRILFLAIPPAPELAAIARILMQGVSVALGSIEEVNEARAAFAEFNNLLFLEATPDRIPWRQHYFSKIYIPPHLAEVARQAATELHRVLAPGGEIVSTSESA